MLHHKAITSLENHASHITDNLSIGWTSFSDWWQRNHRSSVYCFCVGNLPVIAGLSTQNARNVGSVCKNDILIKSALQSSSYINLTFCRWHPMDSLSQWGWTRDNRLQFKTIRSSGYEHGRVKLCYISLCGYIDITLFRRSSLVNNVKMANEISRRYIAARLGLNQTRTLFCDYIPEIYIYIYIHIHVPQII